MNPKKPRNNCLNCKKECNYVNGIYCSVKCQADFRYKKYIKNWLNGKEKGFTGDKIVGAIRKWMLEQNNYKCSKCRWNKINEFSKKSTLEINHIDGNYKNNKLDNLEVLCPNCHSLTKTHRTLNIGIGTRKKHKIII